MELMIKAGEPDNHIREMIVYLIKNKKAQVINLLMANGIISVVPTDDIELLWAVYSGIGNSESFCQGLKSLMTEVAMNNLGIQPDMNLTDFVKDGLATTQGFTNYVNWTGQPVAKKGFSNYVGIDPDDIPAEENTQAAAAAETEKSEFAKSNVGAFLNSLFSPDNINKYIDTGITLVKNKQVLKANQQQLDLAALELQKNKPADGTTTDKNTWVVPVVIGSLVLVGVIITIVVIKSKK